MFITERLQLQQVLEDLLGTRNVYFQPPPNVTMAFPCIVYNRQAGETKFADNDPYNFTVRYKVTLIGKDPDEGTFNKIAGLPMTIFRANYTADNLHHDVFDIYF